MRITTCVANAALFTALQLSVATIALAQSNTEGAIVGNTGGVSGATVVIQSTTTGLKREITADSEGRFSVTSLPTGPYTVTLRQSGKPDVVLETVVRVGSNSQVRFGMEEVVVSGQRVALIDPVSSESALTITAQDLEQLPVTHNVTQVALLAPGVIEGDQVFRDGTSRVTAGFATLASFGGATVGENAYFINGFNVTNFRNGLGGSTVPFQAYQDFQIKTGGYGVEFGRSTGGVINTTTKRGTNEWQFGLSSYYQPDSWSAHSADVFLANGDPFRSNVLDQSDIFETNIDVGGPIIEDRLFIYGIYSYRDREDTNYSLGIADQDKRDDPFWLVKLDAHITDQHIVELTAFSDKDDIERTTFNFDAATRVVGDPVGTSILQRGGENFIAKYTGYLTDTFNISALYGNGKYNRSDIGSGDAFPYVTDFTTGASINLGLATTQQPGTSKDERTAYRLDAEWQLGAHQLRAGFDREENTSSDSIQYSGGVWWRYNVAGTSNVNTVSLTPGTPYVRKRFYENTGDFEVITSAFYLADSWQVTDSVMLTAGLRNEEFDNRNALGSTFIKMSDQWAPRIGASWDVKGNGRSKLFGSLGRYYLPVASNTNARMAGAELFWEEYYQYSGQDATTAAPVTLGAQIGPRQNFADGTVKDPATIVNQNIDPMYQDELVLGFQQQIGDTWAAGLRGTWRDLKVAMEDVAVDAALNEYAVANGFTDFEAGGFDYYVLTNPGEDISFAVDLDGDGTLDPVSLAGSALGYPKATRRYLAFDLFFERAFNGQWGLKGSYTWSHNYGNNEGYVRSDNGQDDAGITTAFDQPGLVDGANGNLPNDRRHQFKLFGVYRVLPEVALSANALALSGRPINCFGVHPTDAFAAEYGNESFFCGSALAPRGSRGTLPWQFRLDMGVEYRPAFLSDALAMKLDIFNVLNAQKSIQISETGELDDGGVDQTYLLPLYYQRPRSVRVGFTYNFGL